MTNASDLPRCALPRRLAAIAYDALLLLAVLLLASAIASPLVGDATVGYHPIYRAYLLLIAFLYFGWSWVHGGQTLGMRTWRVRVQREDGRAITWTQAMLRFVAGAVSWAALGIGFWWSLFDAQKRTWHDIYSESTLVVVPKKAAATT